MINLERVTLICADTYNYGAATASLKRCMAQCSFGRVVLFTNIPLKLEGIEVVEIDELDGKDGYSHFLLKEAYKYIATDFVLVVQHDSWVLDGSQFDENLYGVDYAGALWLENDGLGNGNGGFSWRSLRLMKAVGEDDMINATSPEDVALCRTYRRYLEKNYGLVWASDDICEQFSFELRTPIKPTFGFHGKFHEPYKPTVVIKRKDAMGDVIQVEPVLEYFYNKGFKVVLDTLPQFQTLFVRHYFPVAFPHEVDSRVMTSARVINLDGSYEATPKQLHLKTYFEYACVSDYELRNPKLSLGFELTDDNKMFKNYCVLHTDRRGQASRNIENIDWYRVVQLLISKGLQVIQLGHGEHIKITGAVEMKTINENMLSYVVAGASLMIGIDSGISHIASGFGVPSILFFGSVNPEYIHPNMDKIIAITNHNKEMPVCEKPYCWHSEITTIGVKCYIDDDSPPCTKFKTAEVINAINKLI